MMAAAALGAAALTVPVGAASARPYEPSETLADATPGAAGGLGQAVSISADGLVAVVGEPNAAGGAGAALVYANANGVWTLAQRLTAGSEVGAGHFGAAVSMDGTGQALLVGVPDDNSGVGSAWVFVLADGIWTLQARLVDTRWEDGAGRFGASVALANGGYLAVVGAPTSGRGSGDAFTFWSDYTTHAWSEHQHMNRAAAGTGEHFGASVAVGNDTPAYVGAPSAAGGDGAVYEFSYYGLESSDWQPPTTILPPAGQGSFGASVAVVGMTGDVIVGAPLAGGGVGIAYQYLRNGMLESTFIDPAPSAGGRFGSSVAVAGESLDTVVIGAPGDGAGAGAAYSFDGAYGENWTPGVAMSPASPQAVGDGFGSAVAVSSRATDALVGAPGASRRDGAVTAFLAPDLTVPDPPQEVSVTAAPESATVRWLAPDHGGGAPITGYTATSSPGGLTCAAASDVSCTVIGLTDGQRYTFTVTATNRVGTSPPSAASQAVVPQGGHGGGGAGGDDGGGGGSGGGGGGDGGGSGGGGGGDGGGSGGGGGGEGGNGGGSGGNGGGNGGEGGGTGGTGGGGVGTGAGTGPDGGGSAGGGDRSGGRTAPRRDTTPPARPRGVRASKRTGTSITLAWGPSSDDGGVVAYRIYEFAHGDWRPVGSTPASRRSFVRTGLRRATRHRIEIRAVDAAGNLSAPVIGAWATTG